MWPKAEHWTTRYSDLFLRQARSRVYRSRGKELRASLERLFEDPLSPSRSERLKHQFVGLRSAPVNGRLRLIYRVCEECRRLGDETGRPIECCWATNTPATTVNILCISDHYRDIPANFDFSAT